MSQGVKIWLKRKKFWPENITHYGEVHPLEEVLFILSRRVCGNLTQFESQRKLSCCIVILISD